MDGLLVTVVMATYNRAAYLREALESLKAQTLPADAFEAIIIDDGSTDGSRDILEPYRNDFRVVSRENRGVVASCNEGLALAGGKYIGRLDSDDFVSPHWLERLVEVLEKEPAACCAYPDRYEIPVRTRPPSAAGAASPSFPDRYEDIARFEPGSNQWRLVSAKEGNIYALEAAGTLFRTEMLRRIGGYRSFFWEEYDLYLRLLDKGRFIHVREPLYMYRLHDGGRTAGVASRREGWEELVTEWGWEALFAVGTDPELEALRDREFHGGGKVRGV